jgi:hypothetical protein
MFRSTSPPSAKGKLIVPSLDHGFGLCTRGLVGGIALEARETPRSNAHR